MASYFCFSYFPLRGVVSRTGELAEEDEAIEELGLDDGEVGVNFSTFLSLTPLRSKNIKFSACPDRYQKKCIKTFFVLISFTSSKVYFNSEHFSLNGVCTMGGGESYLLEYIP